MPSSRRVAVYRSTLLPRSETFVAAQARALTRWRPLLVGDLRATPSLSLDGLPSLASQAVTSATGKAPENFEDGEAWIDWAGA